MAAAGIITCTAIPTAILGAKCVSWTNPALLKKYFGWWLVVAATIINLKPYLPALAAASSGGFVVGSAAHLGLVAIMGLGGGFVAGPCSVCLQTRGAGGHARRLTLSRTPQPRGG